MPCHIVEITSPTSQSTMVIARNRYTSVHVFLVIVIHLRYVSVRYYVSYSLLQPSRISPAPATISNNSRSYSLGYPLILNVRQCVTFNTNGNSNYKRAEQLCGPMLNTYFPFTMKMIIILGLYVYNITLTITTKTFTVVKLAILY